MSGYLTTDGNLCLDFCYFFLSKGYFNVIPVCLQCKDGACTLSAMTSGIRRNWIQAIMKNVRPTIAPDVTR